MRGSLLGLLRLAHKLDAPRIIKVLAQHMGGELRSGWVLSCWHASEGVGALPSASCERCRPLPRPLSQSARARLPPRRS